MTIYKIREFAKWAKKARLSDDALCDAIDEMNQGLTGDKLGAFVYKKRVPLRGTGKRGGARCIVAFKKDDVSVFLYGFAKNEKANTTPDEEEALRTYARELMQKTNEQLEAMVGTGSIVKVERSKHEA